MLPELCWQKTVISLIKAYKRLVLGQFGDFREHKEAQLVAITFNLIRCSLGLNKQLEQPVIIFNVQSSRMNSWMNFSLDLTDSGLR